MRYSLNRRLLLGAAATGLVCAATVAPVRAAESAKPAKRVEPPQAEQTEGVAAVNGTKLYYWDTGGSGEAVVFLHPGTGSALIWGYQQPVFARNGYRAIGYSRRGFHGSDAGRGSDTEDLNALMDYLKVDKFHAVGLAGGGITAATYALAHPERLLTLTIACSIVGVNDPEYTRLGDMLRPKGFNEMPPDFRELGPSYRAENPDGVARWLELESMSRSGNAPSPTPGAANLGVLGPGGAPAGPPPSQTTWAKLEAMRTPTLLIAGDADLYTPPSMLRLIGKHMPRAESHIIDESGHSAYWEQPETFNRLVLDFLRQHKRT